MKQIKLILLLIIAGLLILGVCGCMNDGKSNVVDRALAYLKEKYNQDFQVVSSIDSSLDVPYDEIFFKSISYPDATVTVFRKKNEEKECFVDDFYKTLINDEYECLLQSVMNENINQKKIFFNFTADYCPEALDPSYSLSDALNDFGDELFANIFAFTPNTCSEISEALVLKIEKELNANKIKCYLAFYEVDDNDYSLLNAKSYEEYLASNYRLNPVFKTTVR